MQGESIDLINRLMSAQEIIAAIRAGSVSVQAATVGRRRTVGIDPGVFRIVEASISCYRELDLPVDAPSLCTLRGGVLRGSEVSEMLHRLARKAGIQKWEHPHGLRHTHAYELMMEGVAMPNIQRQLGHVSLATTDRYLSHIAPKDVIEAIGEREWVL